MDDDLEQFIRDQKKKLAQERASMQQDPPYMEMRRGHEPTMKENIPPPAQPKDNGSSVSLPLGVEYDQKKQRLQHELRMDYRRHMAQRNTVDPTAGGDCHTLRQRAGFKEASPRAPSRRDASTLTERPEEDEQQEELWRERRAYRPPQRSTRDHPEVGGTKAGRRSGALTNKDEAEFTTGLLIGRNETDSAVQRRKDRYRMELQEQIAEQRRNRKREKDLELRVAATGATDPEKSPDRIKQFGLSRWRFQHSLDPASPKQREPAPPDQLHPPGQLRPPEQPRPAFQSPLLDCVCCERCPHSHTPRIQPLVPHPPSSVPDSYRSVYEGPYHHHQQYYNSPYRAAADHHRLPPEHHRPPTDLSLLYYGQLPMSYLNVPAGGGVSSQLGHHSPQSHPEPSVRVDSVTEPVLHAFPSENKPSRTSSISYKDALKQQDVSNKGSSELCTQIEERAERRRKEKEQADRYDAQLEEDMRRHEPWGRGGGGAPLRDSTGNLITDLKQMHRLNEEAYSKPDQYRSRPNRTAREEPRIDPNDRVSGFAHVQMPQYGRGNVFPSPPTAQQVQEQDSYKTYLKQQIEEKRRQVSEERERARLEEEKEERRLEEQRARIQAEFLEEQEKKRRKEMEQKAKNEELVRLAEERRREEQRMRREEEDKENTALRRQYERERQARLEEVHREPSPPIPTLQKRHSVRHTPRPPSTHSLSGRPPSPSFHSPRPPSTHLPSTHASPRPPPSSTHSQLSSAPLSERCLSGLQSPPVPARRNQLRAAEDNRGVFSELSALRRQLYSEQKRLEEWEEHDPLIDRRRDPPLVDVFDRARLKLQAPVRRPSSKHTEPPNLMNIHTSLQLNDCELPSREEEVSLTRRRRRADSSLRTAHSDYVDLSPLHYLRTTDLLESESAFIEPLGPEPVQLSARERRRNRQTQQQQPNGQADIFSIQSEREASGKVRMGRPQAMGRHGPASRSDDDEEGDFASLPISPQRAHAPNPHSSAETLVTDMWTRMEGLSQREEGPRDWDS